MKLYRALLYLFPASFRREYGEEMSAIFARRRRETSSAAGRFALWAETLVDVAGGAARVQSDILRQDLRYAFRSLRRAPGFTVTAVLVSALGLGATTAAFSMADHVLLRPLPFPQASRLVKLWENHAQAGYSRMELSPPNYRDWKAMSTSFQGIAAYTETAVNLVGDGNPERLNGALVTADMFEVLERQALLGRALTAADGTPGAPDVVVISDSLWRSRFGGDPSVVGRTVTLNDAASTIVGVMPADFQFPTRASQFWRPLIFDGPSDDDRNNYYLRVVARLKADVSLEAGRSELELIAAQLERQYPKENKAAGATVVRLRDEVAAQPRMLLLALVGASLCVLLIAATNLANLLLARALSRQGEVAVRTAIGASPDRLIRQLLTESLVLAGLGGVVGVAIATAAIPLVAKLAPTVLPIAETPALDLRMLTLAGIVTAATGLAFGVLPAWRVARRAQVTTFIENARAGASSRTERLRSTLVVAEVGLSVLLLVCAGLLIQALWRVQQVDPGFSADGVITMRTSLPVPKYETTARRMAFYQQVISDAEALPGVSRAAYISFLPMVMRGGIWPVTKTPASDARPTPLSASIRFASPGFFDALAIPLKAGRAFSDADGPKSLLVAIVSESFVRQHWAGENAIGRRFTMGINERTVVGVVGDIRVRGLERESEPQVYFPAAQQPDGWFAFYMPQDLIVRSAGSPESLVPALRQIIAKADPQQPIANVRTLDDIVREETAPRLVQVRVLGAFAAVALLLAAVGIHGLLAFTVSARTREFGVRLALGAEPARILRAILGQGLWLAALGVAIGVVAALGAGRLMQALLAGVSPGDARTMVVAGALAALMTLAGSLLPALRAMRVDPVRAMRTE